MDSSLRCTVKYAQILHRHSLQAYNPTPAAPPSWCRSNEATMWCFTSFCYSFINSLVNGKKLSNKGNEEFKHTDLSTKRDSGHWMCNRTDSKAAAQIETWEMIIKKKIKLLAGTLECYSVFLNV